MRWKLLYNTHYKISDTGLVVRHLDNNKKNYAADNLCWGTYSDNLQDANCVGRLVLRKKDGHIIQVHRSLADAARTIGLASPSNGGASHIKAVCEGHGKTLKGFTFEYAKEGASYPLE